MEFITEIDPEGIDLISGIRQAYIHLDDVLRHFKENPKHPLDESSSRTLVLARCHLEISLQYAIKTLTFQYEKKHEIL